MAITFDTAVTRPRAADVVGIRVHSRRSRAARRAVASASWSCSASAATSAAPPPCPGSLRGPRRRATASRRPCCAPPPPRWPGRRRPPTVVATALADVDGVDPRAAAQAVAEGFVLGSYRYLALKRNPTPSADRAGRAAGAGGVGGGPGGGRRSGRRHRRRRQPGTRPGQHPARPPDGARPGRPGRGRGPAPPASTSRCSTRTPSPTMGLGGLLGVNQGSTEPPAAREADVHARGGRRPPSPSWARASPTTPAASR